MKRLLIATIALAILLIFGVGCCCGGNSGFTEFMDELDDMSDSGNTDSDVVTHTGYIAGPGTEQEFWLSTSKSPLDVEFNYDPGLDAYCRVLGQSRDELGTLRLNDGNIAELTGGGTFYLIVGSYGGGGNWTATYTP